MSSLAYCLKKLGGQLSDYEKTQLRDAAKAYRKEGFDPQQSNLSAVEDILKELEVSKQNILRQIKEN